MKHIADVGTDVATICFFDAGALPPSLRTATRKHDKDLTALMDEGRLWFQATGADGAYGIHFYVDEDVAPHLRPHLREPKEISRFHVPTGNLWAIGAEYISADVAELTREFSAENRFEIPAGDYALTVWRTEWPGEDFVENEIDRRVGKDPNARAKERVGCWIVPLFFTVIFSLIAGVVNTFKGTRIAPWFWVLAAVSLAAGWLCFRRLKRLQEHDNPARREVEFDYPSVVVQLRRLPEPKG